MTTTKTPFEAGTPGVRVSDLSPDQIRQLVARGQSIRSRYIETAARHLYQRVRALFRRPARSLPAGAGLHPLAR